MSIVVYRERKNPQMFYIAPTLPIFFLVIMPTVGLVSLFLLLAGVRYFHTLRNEIISMVPEQVSRLQHEKKELQESFDHSQQLNIQLQKKISSTSQSSDQVIFPLFKIPLAHKDLSLTNVVSFEGFEITTKSGIAKLNFRIVNTSEGAQKIAGRIFVLLQQLNKITVHPPNSMANEQQQIYYTSGESFAATRFRPVEIRMPIKQLVSNLKFTILIFSRTGDLISKKEFVHQYGPETSNVESAQ